MKFIEFIIMLFKRIFGKQEPQSNPVPIVEENPVSQPTVTPVSSNVVPEGRKFALLVGINKYAMQGADLNGCVNDVENVWEILTKTYGFKADNVRVLTDERATKQNILERLEWLVSNAKPYDQLFFQYSGHGSQTRDRNGDELSDHLDELICPHDMDWDDPLTDDVLATYFKRVPDGAFLSFLCDACHSGSIDRGFGPDNPHPSKARFLPPPMDIELRSRGRDIALRTIGRRDTSRDVNTHYIEQRHLLLSGCRDEQTSADAYIGGKYQGALTAMFTQCLRENPEASWIQLHECTLSKLSGSYTQVPQLTGPQTVLQKGLFKGGL